MAVTFNDPVTGKEISYYMNKRLQANLDKLKEKLKSKDQDIVLVVDGNEGSGKSTFSMQMGKYVDPTLNLDRICMNATEFKDAIIKAKQHECVIYDEAFTGLSSRSTLSEINRMLVSLMMQMRQKNLFVIVVLPSFFMLDKYVALFRARGLFHIFEKNGRHYWYGYNRELKKQAYLKGAKTYSFGKISRYTTFRGEFYGKYPLNEKKYREKKRKALENAQEEIKISKYLNQRDKIIKILKQETNYTDKKIAELFQEAGVPLQRSGITKILGKLALKPANEGM